MKYSIDWLKSEIASGKEFEYIYFWGHSGSRYHGVTKACFSQWHDWFSFEKEHSFHSPKGKQYHNYDRELIVYKTAEHYMMAEKARLFKDEKMAKKIVDADTPKEAKAMGRSIENFKSYIWDEYKYNIVTTGNIYKFGQNKTLRDYLLNTGDKVLVEASPYDDIWGIGMKEGDKGVEDVNNWKGENLLGFALMEARDFLRNHGIVEPNDNIISIGIS